MTATDPGGLASTFTRVVSFAVPLEVNSTGDQGAVDPATRGCDTGGTIAGQPECTLRAAIETANADDGGEITFDIDSSGMPIIAPATELPPLTADITVDGTSQEGGFVRISGSAVVLADGTSKLKGLVIGDTNLAVVALGGTGHVIEGNSLGVVPDGNQALPINFGVLVLAEKVEIRDNRFFCAEACVQVDPSGAGAVVNRNEMGSTRAGVNFGAASNGVLAFGRADITDNVMRIASGAVAVVGPSAADTQVTNNFIGVAADGTTEVGNTGFGVRVEGAPGVAVKDNVITANEFAGVSVTGTDQSELGPDTITFRDPSNEKEGPVTGGNVTVSGNHVGVLGNGSPSVASTPVGVIVWANAANVTISDNTIAGQSGSEGTGIDLRGGSGHTIVSNRLGTDGTNPIRQVIGIDVDGSAGATVGGPGTGNTIAATGKGIRFGGDVGDMRIVGNGIGPTKEGIDLDRPGVVLNAGQVEISNNTIEATEIAIGLDGTVASAEVSNNTVRGGVPAGIEIGREVSDATVDENTVLGAERGIKTSADGTKITNNQVGIDDEGSVAGSVRYGIVVVGDAEVSDNTIAGSGRSAIFVDSDAIGQLRGNEIRQTVEDPIQTGSGPSAPQISTVVRVSEPGETDRTAVIVGGLPEAEAGKVEIFANSSCADGEAEIVTRVVETKRPGRSYVVIALTGQGDNDHFTVTYTNQAQGTSALSECESRTEGIDSDGDGSPDELEELFGFESNPMAALTLSDQGDLVLFATNTGSFTNVGAVDDPDPDGHPGDFTLPHGTFAFEIDDVPVGGDATVNVVVVDGDPIDGDTYFKHGSQQQGEEPAWFEFVPDEATGTGAISEIVDLSPFGLGLARSWTLTIQDGGRGDDGFAPDGRIRDPGGPAMPGSALQDGAVYVPVSPCRIVDTRQAGGNFANREIRDNAVRGAGAAFAGQGGLAGGCGVPEGAQAVEASVTAVSPSTGGFFRAWPGDESMPNATFMNMAPGQDITNTGSIALAGSGTDDLTVRNFGGDTQYVIDVQGYFIDPALQDGAVYVPVSPCRIVDTRQAGGSFANREIRDYAVRGAGAAFAGQGGLAGGCGVPEGAQAVEASATAVSPSTGGFFRAWPGDESMPNATFMNMAPGNDITNTGSIALAGSGTDDLTVRNFGGDTQYVIDVQGYFIDAP